VGNPSICCNATCLGVEQAVAAHHVADAVGCVVDDHRQLVGEQAVGAAHDDVADVTASRCETTPRRRSSMASVRSGSATRRAGRRPSALRSARSASLSPRQMPG
jgi:hypothetical protein